MITVEQATTIVLENALSLPAETVPLHLAVGRVLWETLQADRDFPPFDRVSMDGISICFANFEAGQRRFFIEKTQAAGAPRLALAQTENCIEVMTGAILPQGTDAVIRYEDLSIDAGFATIPIENIQAGQNIHRRGLDRHESDVIVAAGRKISPAEIGVAATVGHAELRVAGLPKACILSSGDELVEVHETPLPHQIRKSNVHVMAAVLGTWGLPADMLHLPDDPAAIEATLSDCLKNYDVLLMSGGVSMGKFDHLPEVLEKIGVRKLFHKVSQRPGKPFWFGRSDSTVVFAFPGNPVSSFMCLHRYFRPWLRISQGLDAFENQYAVLAADYFFKPNLTYFLQVKLTSGKDGRLLATPITGQGSGDLANLVDTDAFLELPLERQEFKAGEVFPVWQYR
ncbi:MAG: molybdopterin molybdotransferase MoeA [Saprospiraceae bacterium]|nr:molybdopterin molybdotransferase MoeA [Saprospiraceae bacterium]MCF8249473.1 molybdopterin molybdotransferase MoeA [Saprospiraceae bacterium]MCF8283156.1 molybdopterin molybdotransferase MoeA [Bacteroidales bacterium]MCF8310691.1 molybdopterin molybdotransferase MoeA [Saprospiraceae bacterium]MCF8439478.1 molybdopterin molybdotransferase MoeA [Saprospiraceae bacterium]